MPSKRSDKPALGTCPSCETSIRLPHKLHLGQIVTCPECGDDLEIVQLSPVIKLDWAFEEPFDDVDYDDDDLDDDDDYEIDLDDFDLSDEEDDY